MIHALGVDITHLAGTVDWTRMRAAGVTFAYVKASDGDGSINPRFNEYWRGAEDAGVLRGAYHCFNPSQINPHQCPNARASWLSTPPGEIPPALSLVPGSALQPGTLAELRDLLEEMSERSGLSPLIRTDTAAWERILGDQVEHAVWARDYPLWVLDDINRSPRVPFPWLSLRWTFWGFTTRGRGPKYGVQCEHINLNLYNGGVDRLKVEFGGRKITRTQV